MCDDYTKILYLTPAPFPPSSLFFSPTSVCVYVCEGAVCATGNQTQALDMLGQTLPLSFSHGVCTILYKGLDYVWILVSRGGPGTSVLIERQLHVEFKKAKSLKWRVECHCPGLGKTGRCWSKVASFCSVVWKVWSLWNLATWLVTLETYLKSARSHSHKNKTKKEERDNSNYMDGG